MGVALRIIGRLGATELRLAGILLPGVIAGFALSSVTSRLLDRGFTRIAVLGTAAVSGLVVIVQQLL